MDIKKMLSKLKNFLRKEDVLPQKEAEDYTPSQHELAEKRK